MNYGTSISIGVIDSVLRGICFIFSSISERLNDFDVIIFWTGIIMFTTMAMSTLEPTIPIWIIDTMKAPKWQLGTYPEMIYKYYEIQCTCSATFSCACCYEITFKISCVNHSEWMCNWRPESLLRTVTFFCKKAHKFVRGIWPKRLLFFFSFPNIMRTTNCTSANIDRILEISTSIHVPTVQINGRTKSKLRHGKKNSQCYDNCQRTYWKSIRHTVSHYVKM